MTFKNLPHQHADYVINDHDHQYPSSLHRRFARKSTLYTCQVENASSRYSYFFRSVHGSDNNRDGTERNFLYVDKRCDKFHDYTLY